MKSPCGVAVTEITFSELIPRALLHVHRSETALRIQEATNREHQALVQCNQEITQQSHQSSSIFESSVYNVKQCLYESQSDSLASCWVSEWLSGKNTSFEEVHMELCREKEMNRKQCIGTYSCKDKEEITYDGHQIGLHLPGVGVEWDSSFCALFWRGKCTLMVRIEWATFQIHQW